MKNSFSIICQTDKPTIISNWISKTVDQHIEVKWLIQSTKYLKDILLQSLELPCRMC